MKQSLIKSLSLVIASLFLIISFGQNLAIAAYALKPNVFIVSAQASDIQSDGMLDTKSIVKKFYETNPDKYDFLALYTNFPSTKNQASGEYDYFMSVKDDTASYGSAGRLMGFAVINEIQKYQELSGDLLHELSHYWLASIDQIKRDPNVHLTRGDGHWSHLLDTSTQINGRTYISPNSGSPVKDNGDGTFSEDLSKVPTSRHQRFNSAELYLMGLLPKQDVKPMKLVVPSGESFVRDGIKVTPGSVMQITADDLTSLAGERSPAYPSAPKNFNVAFVLVSSPNVPVNQTQIDGINWVGENFPQEWWEATGGKSTLNGIKGTMSKSVEKSGLYVADTNPQYPFYVTFENNARNQLWNEQRAAEVFKKFAKQLPRKNILKVKSKDYGGQILTTGANAKQFWYVHLTNNKKYLFNGSKASFERVKKAATKVPIGQLNFPDS